MAMAFARTHDGIATLEGRSQPIGSPSARRLLLLLLIGAAVAGGVFATGAAEAAQAVADAGADLVRLLRVMAALKVGLAVGATAAVLWRFRAPVTPAWFAAYAIACGAMGAGPALIWSMAHVGMGALLLHGGLAAAVLLLWRDPGVADRLSAMIAARRASLAVRASSAAEFKSAGLFQCRGTGLGEPSGDGRALTGGG